MASFEVDLLMCYEQVAERNDLGLNALKEFKDFIKRKAEHELEHGKSLLKTINSSGLFGRGKDWVSSAQNVEGTLRSGLLSMHENVKKEADHHIRLSSSLFEISNNTDENIKTLEIEKKRLSGRYLKEMKILNSSVSALDKAQAKYQKSMKEADDAVDSLKVAKEAFEKALIPSDIKKLQGVVNKCEKKSLGCEDKISSFTKKYEESVEKTNNIQSNLYESIMPTILCDMEKVWKETYGCLEKIGKTFFEEHILCYKSNQESVLLSFMESFSNVKMGNDFEEFITNTKSNPSFSLKPIPYEFDKFCRKNSPSEDIILGEEENDENNKEDKENKETEEKNDEIPVEVKDFQQNDDDDDDDESFLNENNHNNQNNEEASPNAGSSPSLPSIKETNNFFGDEDSDDIDIVV